MKVKFSPKFKHVCDICGKEGTVFTLGDEESKRAVTICESCINDGKITDPAELIERHGKVKEEPFKPGVRYERKSVAG